MAYNAITNGQNLGFKAGLQTSLDTYLKGGTNEGKLVEGIFYLTTDTNRLYIGRKDSTDNKVYPVPVNQGILPIDDFSKLPTSGQPGEFYYLKNSNILCVWSGDGWVQINADTTLASNEQNVTISSKTNNTVDISSSVLDTKSNESKGNFSLVEGNNITLTPDTANNKITVEAKDTTHTLGVEDGAKLILTNNLDANDKDTVIFTAADTETGKKYGNLTSKTTTDGIEYTLDVKRQSPTGVTLSNGATSGFEIEITNPLDDNISSSIDPVISYGATPVDAKFIAGKATLDVYTKTETDAAISNALTAADAMTFKGVLEVNNNVSNAPTTGTANAGDTYKVGSAGTFFGHACDIGDLLIAAKDGASYTAAADWYYIPSGDDQVISGDVIGGTSPSITITDQANTLGQMILNAGTDINILGTEAEGSESVTVSIGHATYAAVSNESSGNTQEVKATSGVSKDSETFTAITEITNNNGHITGIKTSEITIHDTHNQITAVSEQAINLKGTGAEANKILGISIAPVISTTDSETFTTTKLNIKSNTLKLEAADTASNEAVIDLVWGTF